MDISYELWSCMRGRAEEQGKWRRGPGPWECAFSVPSPCSYILSPFLPLHLSGLEHSVLISLFTSTALSENRQNKDCSNLLYGLLLHNFFFIIIQLHCDGPSTTAPCKKSNAKHVFSTRITHQAECNGVNVASRATWRLLDYS